MTNTPVMNVRRTLTVNGKPYTYFSIPALNENGVGDFARLPFSLKVLLENLLRHQADSTHIAALSTWLQTRTSLQEIAYRPVRVLMQDFSGVPAVVDLAAMRDAVAARGGDAKQINPQICVDLVIDHSVQVDYFGHGNSFAQNVELEMQRNQERYEFLHWGQHAFKNFRVVPPGTGICHQINLEYLAQVIWQHEEDGTTFAYPDTVVGTDSHTTMVNSLGVLGWGVGGIEAEAAMLGQPVSMLIPEVIGVKLTGTLREGITATDLVLTITQMLRKRGVVDKFVEFYGPGLAQLPLADRATIANMAPEYGATCGFFPVDEKTIDYLSLSGRDAATIALVEAYSKAQGLWNDPHAEPLFTDSLTLDLSHVEASVAGPKRPQDRVTLTNIPAAFTGVLQETGKTEQATTGFPCADFLLHHGDVVIAAITSCTNTSNPSVLMAAGLLAKKAVAKGLRSKPWVKTSLAPGSKVVTEYLQKAGLQTYLDQLGFNLVGYGCTTCIGNSGPLPDAVSKAITDHQLEVCGVLSGNRNFEGRIHAQVKANWLASPPLVVAFALAGNTRIDLTRDPIGHDSSGQPVYLKDIWPSNAEVAQAVSLVDNALFRKQYANVFAGDAHWQALRTAASETYPWQTDSTYIAKPPYFADLSPQPKASQDIHGAYILALLGDSITTDHISPAGSIKTSSPAGQYLTSKGVAVADFNSYGSRRGNHEIMMRATFANTRIRNEMAPGTEGGVTTHIPSGQVMSIYDAAMQYQAQQQPLVVIAGKEYGTGSSRDWAAKGAQLLGVNAVIAESYERIHRSNLIGMGVLPLQFVDGATRKTLSLDGSERIDITGLAAGIRVNMQLQATLTRRSGETLTLPLLCRIQTDDELNYYRHGGILCYVLRNLLQPNHLA